MTQALSRSARTLAFIIPVLFAAVWTVLAGKDVSWDLLNYHYYVPYEWLHDRLAQDYFAASGQSYLNPVGYLPFYAMVASGWHSVVASMALAAFHGTALGFAFLIAWRVFGHRPLAERRSLAILATLLAGSTAVYWAMVGGSFLEPLLAVPMIAAVTLLVDDSGTHPQRRALSAGLLFGVATALKYYNGIFALAALPLAIALSGHSWRARLRAGATYAAGGAVALAVFAGPWMLLMWRKFGNPVFPLFNGWFRSPEAPPSNMFAGRFAVHGLGDALAFPFRLIAPYRALYAEITAPDLRFAPLVLAFAALPLVAALHLRPPKGSARLGGADRRLLGFFCAAYALWLATSANGRYGVIVLLLAGLCLARLAERLLPFVAARSLLVVLVLVQIVACAMVSETRWFVGDRWSASWLPFAPAEQAVREPALYLTVETLPMAAVVPFVNSHSAFVNLRGQYSIPPGTPQLGALLDRYRGRVRALGRYLRLDGHGRPSRDVVDAYDSTLIRYGYRIDPERCFGIPWQPDDADALSRAANWLAREPSPQTNLSLGSCALQPARRELREIEAERQATEIFDRIERRCAGLLDGQKALTESFGKEWMRNYPALDARLETYRGHVILERYLALSYVDLGPLAFWQRDAAWLPKACRGAP